MTTPDWSGSSGDIWARRWRDTDRALGEVGAALDAAIAAAAPAGPFRALDIGCGPGTTSLSLAALRSDATVLGCDLSQALVAVAGERAGGQPNVSFVAQDAEAAASGQGPFELFFSRHGVMFFDDPTRAFRTLRGAAAQGAQLIFSCFRSWGANPWASELSSAAAGAKVDPPGREPSGFAFADPDYVGDILRGSGWGELDPRPLDFDYVAGSGPGAVAQALDFLAEVGPASRITRELVGDARDKAVERMGEVVRNYEKGGQILFPGAAWIWTATAA